MHLGSFDRKVEREAAAQSAQVMVSQSQGSDHQWRLRGNLSFSAAAARLCRIARLGLFGSLSLPCTAWRDAAASNRYRPVQAGRVQTERADHLGPLPGLLEKRSALSRR